MDKTLGAKVVEAARAALDDAGITPDEVDGIVTSAGGQTNHVSLGSQWGPTAALLRPAVRHGGRTHVRDGRVAAQDDETSRT